MEAGRYRLFKSGLPLTGLAVTGAMIPHREDAVYAIFTPPRRLGTAGLLPVICGGPLYC